jgi:hypothetical protein
LLAPAKLSTQIPYLVEWTLRARGQNEPPKIKFYQANPPRGATFVCWPLQNSQSIHPHLVEWTLQAPGLGKPPKIKFYQANPPRGAIFVCWPPHNYKCIHPLLEGWTLLALGWGEPPSNKILPGKPTPKSNFCLLAPAQFCTLQGFSDGHYGVYPWGATFGVAPWLGAEPG